METDTDLNYDFDRSQRLGFPEIVYGERKTAGQIQEVVLQCRVKELPVFISRCAYEKIVGLEGGAYDAVAQTWAWHPVPPTRLKGLVGVVSAGTSDNPVVRECANTLAFLGIDFRVVQDVGVAGIHRFLNRLEDLRACDVLVCVAGFEGALASVMAGQCPQPVIAVPTSVGYGVSHGGMAALNAMLSSCANGLMVMNIDNGVGAALAARRVLGLLNSLP